MATEKVCPQCGYGGYRITCPKCRVPLLAPPEPVRVAARRVQDVCVGVSAIHTLRGGDARLEVFEDKVTITPTSIWSLRRGPTEIPFASIAAVQFKTAGALFGSGHLQFTLVGVESTFGLLGAIHDVNTFIFAKPAAKNNAQATEIKAYIDGAIRKARTPHGTSTTTNLSDELMKVARLREQGVLTEEEFRAAKMKLIA